MADKKNSSISSHCTAASNGDDKKPLLLLALRSPPHAVSSLPLLLLPKPRFVSFSGEEDGGEGRKIIKRESGVKHMAQADDSLVFFLLFLSGVAAATAAARAEAQKDLTVFSSSGKEGRKATKKIRASAGQCAGRTGKESPRTGTLLAAFRHSG